MTSIRRRACLIVAIATLASACERPAPDGASATIDTVDTSDDSGDPSSDTVDTTDTTEPPTTTPDDTTASTTPATTTPPTTTPVTTDPDGAANTTSPTTSPPTTAEPAPTTAPPTTEAPAPTSPADLVLAFDGVSPFEFGEPDTDVVPALVELLGEPIVDQVAEYPDDVDGQFVGAAEMAFVAPFGRTVCFSNGLCTEFGAGSATALQFVGWSYSGDDEAEALATEDGITVGSVWADHTDTIVADQGACFDIAYASAEGVDVTLLSTGVPFVEIVDGEFETRDPDPADVTVATLTAGDLPAPLFFDC